MEPLRGDFFVDCGPFDFSIDQLTIKFDWTCWSKTCRSGLGLPPAGGVSVCLLPPSHKAMADKGKHGRYYTKFRTDVKKKICPKDMFLAVILRDYIVICPPGNPRCTIVRLRLTGGLSLVLAQDSALKWNLSFN